MRIPRRFEDPEWPGHVNLTIVMIALGCGGGAWGWVMSVVARSIGVINLVLVAVTLPVFMLAVGPWLRRRFERRSQAVHARYPDRI